MKLAQLVANQPVFNATVNDGYLFEDVFSYLMKQMQ